VIPLAVGTDQSASQHPHSDSEPVTLVATSSQSSSVNRHNAIVRYAVTCAGSFPSERLAPTPNAATAASTASRGTAETSTPNDT
jgi:hypothetical protein